MATYRPVGVDEDWNLPPEARTALAGSTELSAAMDQRVVQIIAVSGEPASSALSRINAALDAGSSLGVRKTVRLIGDFYVNGPVVVPSRTTIDSRAASVTLVAGSYTNALVNKAAIANARTIYAAIASGSATLTAAGTDMSTPSTPPFSASMVGKRIEVQGAGPGGAPLVSTVAAFVSASQITLATAASTSVTGQYASVGDRDVDVSVIGGRWKRDNGNNNWGSQGHYLTHTLRFRHVDGIRISDLTFDGSTGKYAVSGADVTDVQVRNIYIPQHASDGVHISGPASNVTIRDIVSDAIHDDVVSLTAGDSTGSVDRVRDTAGDISHVYVDTAMSKVATYLSSMLKVVAGVTMDGSNTYAVRNVRARNLVGPNTYAPLVYVGDGTGGIIDGIDVDGVRSIGSTGSANGVVLIHGGTVGKITLRNLFMAPADSGGVAVDVSVDDLRIDGLYGGSPGLTFVKILAGTTSRLSIQGARPAPIVGTTTGGRLVQVSTGSTIGKLLFSDCDLITNMTTVVAQAGSSLGSVQMRGITASGAQYPCGVYQSVTKVYVDGLDAVGATNLLWVQGSGAVTLTGLKGINSDATKTLGNVTTATAPIQDSPLPSASALLVGDETLSRLLSTGTPTLNSGRLILTYFTALKTKAITKIEGVTSSPAASGTTLARIGIYEVASNGNLTLVASTDNDTALWGTPFGGWSKTLSATWNKVAGQRYAVGVLFVGTTAPKVSGLLPLNGTLLGRDNRLAGNINSQTDLPSTLAANAVTSTEGALIYAAMTP